MNTAAECSRVRDSGIPDIGTIQSDKAEKMAPKKFEFLGCRHSLLRLLAI